MRVRLSEIVWDTEGASVELPQEVVVQVEDDFDVVEDAADLLSDMFGWCVVSLQWEKA